MFLERYKKLHRIAKPLAVLVIFGISAVVYFTVQYKQQPLAIHQNDIVVMSPQGRVLDTQIADTNTERQTGLSHHTELKKNQAMLFIFDRVGNYPFWMKDMDFPIDIFWLNESKQVVAIKEFADPSEYPHSYNPDANALYVLETVAGFADTYGIEYGQAFSWEE